ncbi:MAG: hypothetical protein KGK30_07325, partial [Elusimicrobia bacterium]|nr:hypothetical protein [Elusimicrobiota bacterium]
MATPSAVRVIDDIPYERVVVRTHLIGFSEDIVDVIRKYALPKSRPGDWIAISEKVVSVTQNNMRHISTVKAGWLAKLITKGVKKYPDDLGWNNPTKMQLVVEIAGTPRTMLAMVLGAIGKAVGVRGIFWLVVSHRLAEIDGFNPVVMPPYNEYAALPPVDPKGVCQRIERETGLPAVIIDGNNINIKV